MDQETAKKLVEEGAIFCFLDVPEGTEFGIDLKSWNTGERFRGVKMVPPGLHYIFYSGVDGTTGDTAPRSGFFWNSKKSETFVKKWNPSENDASESGLTEDQISAIRDNIKVWDKFLGPYPYDIYNKWKHLSADISESVVKRLTPHAGLIRSALELEPCTDANRPRSSSSSPGCSSAKRFKLSEKDLLPDLKAKSGTDIRVTCFPEKCYPPDSTPAEITRHSLDSSYVFEQMVSKYEKPEDLVGEMEFCFICFLVGQSLEAFEQWKRILDLFATSEAVLKKYRKLYNLLITVLVVQILEIPEEFLADIVTNKNFVYTSLRMLFRNIMGSNVDGQLKSKTQRFMRLLTDTFTWDFEHLESEEDEDAPVIVKM